MTCHNSLRDSCGTGSEYDIDGIHIQTLSTDLQQSLLINLFPDQILIPHQLFIISQFSGVTLRLLITDDRPGVQCIKDQPDPMYRHLLINGDVVTASIQHAEECIYHIRMLSHIDHYRFPVEPSFMKCTSDGLRTIGQFTEGDPLLSVGESSFIRDPVYGPFHIFQNIRHFSVSEIFDLCLYLTVRI